MRDARRRIDISKVKQQESKEKRKYTLKVSFISIVSTLIVIVGILLFTIVGLKKCSNKSSSSSSSSYTEKYDSAELDNVFKKIVKTQMDDYGFDEDPLLSVVAVSYIDNSSSFDLTISVTSASKVYIYKIENSGYQGYDDFVSYILANNNEVPLTGSVALDRLVISTDTVLHLKVITTT